MRPGELRWSSLRSVIGIAAILLLLAGTAQLDDDPPTSPDAPQVVLTSFTGAVIANGDHLHLKQVPSPGCPKTFDAGILPQLDPGVMPLGLLVALIVVSGWVVERLAQSGRGPPAEPVSFHSGRDLLTRFCIARR